MNRFTHGIVVINPNVVDENGDYPVVHFVGYWDEPAQEDFESLKKELETDEDFGLRDILNEL